jgi:RHS repeat-associated protein
MDNTSALQDHVDYSGFGNPIESTSGFGDRYKFSGREFDSSAKIQYNWARDIDPSTGRWMSQDPISFAAGDTNLYRYVNNNPINHTDPSGLYPKGNLANFDIAQVVIAQSIQLNNPTSLVRISVSPSEILAWAGKLPTGGPFPTVDIVQRPAAGLTYNAFEIYASGSMAQRNAAQVFVLAVHDFLEEQGLDNCLPGPPLLGTSGRADVADGTGRMSSLTWRYSPAGLISYKFYPKARRRVEPPGAPVIIPVPVANPVPVPRPAAFQFDKATAGQWGVVGAVTGGVIGAVGGGIIGATGGFIGGVVVGSPTGPGAIVTGVGGGVAGGVIGATVGGVVGAGVGGALFYTIGGVVGGLRNMGGP